MQVISSSLFCQFILLLRNKLCVVFESSTLIRMFHKCFRVWARWRHGSAVVYFLFEREGVFTRTWPDSLTRRLLSGLFNLPANLLHWLYCKFKAAFDNSFCTDIIFAIGDHVPVATGWFMLLIMNIPYERWSNTYSLIGYLFLFLLAMAGGMRRSSLRIDAASVGPFIPLFFLAVYLSWPLSYFPTESFRYLFYYFSCFLCVYLIVGTVERAEQLERLAGFACLAMTGAAGYGILQRIQGLEVNDLFVDAALNPNMPSRIFSYYHNPNSFAEMLLLLIPVSIGLLFGTRKKSWRFAGLLSAGISLVAMVMTYSRGTWIGLVIAALVFLFFWNRKLIPVCILAGLVCLPILPEAVLTRILSIFNPKDTSTSSRLPFYRAALRMIKTSPITGAGLGNYAVRYSIQTLNLYDGYNVYIHSHNTFLELWLQTGLLGLVSFLGTMFSSLKQGAKVVQNLSTPRSIRMIILGALSGLAGSLVCGLADYLWNYPRVMLIFWFTVALLLAGIKLAKQEA